MKTVGYFARPWHSEYFPLVLAAAFPDADLVRWDLGEHEPSGRFARLSREALAGARRLDDPPGELRRRYPDLPYPRVKAGCRELRALSDRRAAAQILACLDVYETLDLERPVDVFFGPLIDGYQVDVLRWFLNRRGKDYVSLVGSIFPGRSTVCVNGALPTPSTLEQPERFAEAMAALRDKSRIPRYLSIHTEGSQLRRSVVKWAKVWARLGYFGALTTMFPGRIQPHIAQSYYASKYIAQPMPIVNLSRKSYDPDRRFDFLVPLHWYPEATIDYMTDYVAESDYREQTRRLVTFLATRGTVLVREHPAVAGLRFRRLFDEIEAIDGVYISDLKRNARLEVEQADAVVVVTSNLGLESLADGVPVLACTRPYYDIDGILPVFDPGDAASFDAAFADARRLVGTEEGHRDVERLMRRYFSTSCDAPFVTNGFKLPMTPEEHRAAAGLGRSLAEFLRHTEKPLLSQAAARSRGRSRSGRAGA